MAAPHARPMMKRFKRALVVGKFAPLHLGHDFLIRTALSHAEELILLSYSNPEFPRTGPETRESWLRGSYPQAHVHVLKSDNAPRNSDDDDIHRTYVAEVYRDLVNKPLDAVFTSENYGVGFAQKLTEKFLAWNLQNHRVEHINVDQSRKTFPISGTEIRKDLHANRHFLVSGVYATFVESVCFLGAESTGKSTLAPLMAETLKTTYTEEYGRTLWDAQNGKLAFDDFMKIARTQIEMENAARNQATKMFFADTSPLTTLFYSYEYHGKADPELVTLSKRKYDHIFLCVPDFPLVQDGTRSDEKFRQRQHDWYLETLKRREVNFNLLTGGLESRKHQILKYLALASNTATHQNY